MSEYPANFRLKVVRWWKGGIDHHGQNKFGEEIKTVHEPHWTATSIKAVGAYLKRHHWKFIFAAITLLGGSFWFSQ